MVEAREGTLTGGRKIEKNGGKHTVVATVWSRG